MPPPALASWAPAFAIAMVTLSQVGVVVAKQRHPQRYTRCTAVGLGLVPITLSLHLRYWRFVGVWCAYAALALWHLRLATRQPLAPAAPRAVYAFFARTYRLCNAACLAGAVVLALDSAARSAPALLALLALPPPPAPRGMLEGGLLLTFYGVYVGVLNRDAAEACTDALAHRLGIRLPKAPGGGGSSVAKSRAAVMPVAADELPPAAASSLAQECRRTPCRTPCKAVAPLRASPSPCPAPATNSPRKRKSPQKNSGRTPRKAVLPRWGSPRSPSTPMQLPHKQQQQQQQQQQREVNRGTPRKLALGRRHEEEMEDEEGFELHRCRVTSSSPLVSAHASHTCALCTDDNLPAPSLNGSAADLEGGGGTGGQASAVTTLECGHRFHNSCIRGWTIIGKKDTCE